MYKEKYERVVLFNGKIKSSLDSQFKFWKEVSPADRPAVRDRIRGLTIGGRCLGKYDALGEALSVKNFVCFYCSFIEGMLLRFDAFDHEDADLKPEELFSSEAINHYILTGELHRES
jgi:hypothetical protein